MLLFIGSFFGIVVLAAVVVIVRAGRRSRRGASVVAAHGWTRVPDGTDVVQGWDGWPFRAALEHGRAVDIVHGHDQGVELMCLRWRQRQSGRGDRSGDSVSWNIVALRCEVPLPCLSVVRGKHRVQRGRLGPELPELESGDAHFDRRWQQLGDAQLARDVLTPEVRAAMDERGHAWAFQPGWVTRVVPWRFYAGEQQMFDVMEDLVAPLRLVPDEVWARYGGPPGFLRWRGPVV